MGGEGKGGKVDGKCVEKGKVRGGKGDGKFEEKGKESEGKRGTEEGKVKWRMKKKEEGKGNLRVEGEHKKGRCKRLFTFNIRL